MASRTVAETLSDEWKEEYVLNSSLRTCANDPDFAVICAFLQKFSRDLGIDIPNFKLLQEWLTNTEEVSSTLRDLHIKLLRKTRRTVHEKSWESALSKFCFSYSLQDAWEIERFTYKNSSPKVKLRILRELLESQFERNTKFRAKILTLSADSLRSEPIGRDRHGHTYWLTQDNECNMRIYQEHLDEDIWRVVATNRAEFVNLIARLRGNEVVLPSTDIGTIDEDSSSNSCYVAVEKPPPPEEKEDSQEDEGNVPNLKIKLNNATNAIKTEVMQVEKTMGNKISHNKEETKPKDTGISAGGVIEKKVKPLIIAQCKAVGASPSHNSNRKRNLDDHDRGSPTFEVQQTVKKTRPLLMDSKPFKNQSKYMCTASEDDLEDDEEDDEGEDEDAIDGEEECEEEDIDSAAADTCENDEKEIEDNDFNENNSVTVGDAIEDPPVIFRGSGFGKDCDGKNFSVLKEYYFEREESIVGDPVEEETMYVVGNGDGALNLVGNDKTTKEDDEPKATFFFGEPGCLKLSPIKAVRKPDISENASNNLNTEGEQKDKTVKELTQNYNSFQTDFTYVQSKNNEKVRDEGGNELCNLNDNNKKSDDVNVVIEAVDKNSQKIRVHESIENAHDNSRDSDEILSLIKINENRKNNIKQCSLSDIVEKAEKDNAVENCKFGAKEKENTLTMCKQIKNEEIPSNEEKSVNGEIAIVSKCKSKDITATTEEVEVDDIRAYSPKPPNPCKAIYIDEPSQQILPKAIEDFAQEDSLIKPAKQDASPAHCSFLNRKRRLTQLNTITPQNHEGSESENGHNSEHLSDDAIDKDANDAHCGGKRLKIRCKLSNPELRRKIEAKKAHAIHDENTSSSGEESQLHRQHVITKRIREKASNTGAKKWEIKNEAEVFVAKTPICIIQKTITRPKSIHKSIEISMNKGSEEKSDGKLNAIELAEVSPAKKNPVTKPLEKNVLTKLRNNESNEKNMPQKRAISDSKQETETVKEEFNVLNIDVGMTNESIKKDPCTAKNKDTTLDNTHDPSIKNSQRNLLEQVNKIDECQLNQNSITDVTKDINKLEDQMCTEKSQLDIKTKLGIDKINEIQQIENTFPNVESESLDENQEVPESKIRKMKSADVGIDNKTPEHQRKRHSSEDINENEEIKPAVGLLIKNFPNKKKYGVVAETKVKTESSMQIKENLLVLQKELTPPAEPIGRRSGRRNASLVVYAELPQPKRTRSIAATPAFVTPKAKKTVAKIQSEGATRFSNTKLLAKNENNKGGTAKVTPPKTSVTPSIVCKKIGAVIPSTVTTELAKKVKPLRATEKNTVATVKKCNPTHVKITSITTTTTTVHSKLEVDTTNIIDVQDSDTPIRQSRRIAQQKIREEAERRKLEEIALRTMKQEFKKKKIAEKEVDPTVMLPSEDSSSSVSVSSAIEASAIEKKRKTKKKRPGKDGSWSSGSEEEEEPEEEDEEPAPYSDHGSPLFRSDHEFSPESDLEDESQIVPMKRARTVRKEEGDGGVLKDEEEACQKCGKSDHPEWILLCDKCDKGYHCSCLSPVLFYIPEGDWFCPPCQQEQLILELEKQLQAFDTLVERKRVQDEEEKQRKEKIAEEERERLNSERLKRDRKKQRKNYSKRSRSEDVVNDGNNDADDNDDDDEKDDTGESMDASSSDEDVDTNGRKMKRQNSDECSIPSDNDGKVKKKSDARTNKYILDTKKTRRVRGDRPSRRKAAKRCDRQRRRNGSVSSANGSSLSSSRTNNSSSTTDSEDEPIYKLRKRRQINVSYRLNEYDHLIDSVLKKEMDEAVGAGNLGRGKDITTIIEADKEEKAKNDENSNNDDDLKGRAISLPEQAGDNDCCEAPIKSKSATKNTLKKKSRKLTTLDISSEEDDDGSDEDFKTSSMDDDDDEDTSICASSNSDSSLEVYRRRKGGKNKQRNAAKRAAKERRKDHKFVVDDSFDDEDDLPLKVRAKKKNNSDSDFTETEVDEDELSEVSENLNSSDLCDDSSSNESDGAWRPSKLSKKHKVNIRTSNNMGKLKKAEITKSKRLEYSDDDLSESEEETEDEEDDVAGTGKGSGKQPRSQPIKTGGKLKTKPKSGQTIRNNFSEEDMGSLSDSGDSTRRTRGKRYAYIEDFDDESSDGGIKPGVKRPDTPPEERQKFIEKQEEIKRMLAAKNAEGAKLAATPRLTPIKAASASNDKQGRSPGKTGAGDALSAVPLSVIRQAKVLDIDYLQRKGEPLDNVLDNVDDVDSEFDDTDLPDDLPEDMDEDTIARMVEEEEEFSSSIGTRELSSADKKFKDIETAEQSIIVRNSSLEHVTPSGTQMASIPTSTISSTSSLQEPLRKRLPMPTLHPPLLRHHYHQPPDHLPSAQIITRQPLTQAPTMHLLQNALSAPIGQHLRGNFLHHQHQRMPNIGGPSRQMAAQLRTRLQQEVQGSIAASATVTELTGDTKPRGRRKKITPLRDPMQKQQAAAAVAAAANASANDKKAETVAITAQVPIKQNAQGLNIAQSPQLLTSSTIISTESQPSVITRTPLVSQTGAFTGVRLPPSVSASCQPEPTDMARYFNPTTVSGQRLLQSPGSLAGMAPHGSMRPTYGPPPLHTSNPNPSGVPATNLSRIHVSDQTITGMYARGVAPPPARHSTAHLNPYRPPIYGNPNYPRGVTTRAGNNNLRLPHAIDYAPGPRGYSPYGYYAPPPPLRTQHMQTQSTIQHQTTQSLPSTPSSVIVTTSQSGVVPATKLAPIPINIPTNHSVSAITRVKSPTSIPLTDGAQTSTPPLNSPPLTRITAGKNADNLQTTSVVAAPLNMEQLEPRKKLTTLETYTTVPVEKRVKSPLQIVAACESSNSVSRGSPTTAPDTAEDSLSATGTTTARNEATASSEIPASEFSGLVSYFSAQHDDYNS